MLVTQSFHSLARKGCVTMDKDDTQLHCNYVGGLKILEFVKLFNTAPKASFKSPGFSNELVFGKIISSVVKRLRTSSEMCRISSLGSINVSHQPCKPPCCSKRWTRLNCPSLISTLGQHGDTLQSSVRGGYARGSTPYTLYTILTQKVRLHVSYILNWNNKPFHILSKLSGKNE